MSGRRHDDEEPDENAAPLSHNPFGALSSLRDKLPAGESPKKARTPRFPPLAVVRLEKKGAEEREVTAIAELRLTPKALARWLEELTEELHCGGAIDGDTIYLQGDQRAQLEAVLVTRKVAKVVFE